MSGDHDGLRWICARVSIENPPSGVIFLEYLVMLSSAAVEEATVSELKQGGNKSSVKGIPVLKDSMSSFLIVSFAQ